MFRKFLFCLTLMLICGLNLGNAAVVEVGFLYLGDNGPFTKPAMEFAKDTFKTTELGKGDIKSDKLKNFAVVWWNEGDSDPGALSNAELDAFMDYAESGGALLLTGKAFSYATPMGLENAQPRAFGPILDDGSKVGIIVLQETLDLGLVEGLVNVDGKAPKLDDRIQLNSTGYPKSGDYFDSLAKNFTTLAHAWEGGANYTDRIAAFGYWKAGDGKVFNMNWRLPNYHENNKSRDQLEQITENVINWLASESAYLDVSSHGKLPVVWGHLKNQR
ncbi:MAG: hypothetical protein OXM61_11470 [Candidatus Poribacteria bacterium]|nr:hypothetical protein [Candidatus Poribacteria bacterium]